MSGSMSQANATCRDVADVEETAARFGLHLQDVVRSQISTVILHVRADCLFVELGDGGCHECCQGVRLKF
jgi:hypothetical protein